jgi:hypothetical protein
MNWKFWKHDKPYLANGSSSSGTKGDVTVTVSYYAWKRALEVLNESADRNNYLVFSARAAIKRALNDYDDPNAGK